MNSKQDDSIEFSEDPYRRQLERTIHILEMEIELRKNTEARELEASRENKLLTQDCIEQRNVIQELKTQLHQLLTKATMDQCLSTDETNETIQKALDKIRPYKDMYQDLYPTLSKLVIQDTMPREDMVYDKNTVHTILEEAYGPNLGYSSISSSNVSSHSNLSGNLSGNLSEHHHSPRDIDITKSQIMTPNKDTAQKKGFDWGIFGKFTSGNKEIVNTGENQQFAPNHKDKSDKRQKEWDSIHGEINKGKTVWILKKRIEAQFKNGSFIPQNMRSVIWRRLLGNRSRVTARIYRMLMLQLPNANPQVKKCIVLDVNRSFANLSKSAAFETVKQESIKILQLFEVALV
jgi:hypothetical protein